MNTIVSQGVFVFRRKCRRTELPVLFPSTSDCLLLPLTMQATILLQEAPESGYFLWPMVLDHAILQDSYSEVVLNIFNGTLNQ